MRLSVVIPTYNRLDSLKVQLPRYLMEPSIDEIVVVDDGSLDGTSEWLKAMREASSGKLKIARRDKNQGLPAARNLGARMARGQWILFGEDDLYFQEGSIEKLLAHAQEQDAKIAGPRLIAVPLGQTPRECLKKADAQETGPPYYDPVALRGTFHRPWDAVCQTHFLHACCLVNRDLILQYGYDEGLGGNATYEESDFYLRSIRGGAKMIFCPDTVAFHIATDGTGGCRRADLRAQVWALRNSHRFWLRHGRYLIKSQGWDCSLSRIYGRAIWRIGSGIAGHILFFRWLSPQPGFKKF